MSDTAVIVLAAGQGTRMKSRRAKVLHELCGVPMLGHVLRSAKALAPSRLIVVIGRDADEVRSVYEDEAELVLQEEQHGTGHAVRVAEPALEDFSGDVLVLYGDTPLLRSETLERMRAVRRESGADLVMLTARAPSIPGRVVRGGDGRVVRVVEAQDASPEELAIEERNTGVYLFEAGLLREGLASLRPDNEQGELYITDVVGYAVDGGRRVEALEAEDPEECLGINTRRELADAARAMRRRIVDRHMDEGVSFTDPDSVYLDADVRIGRDSILEPGVVITGESTLGEGVHVKSGCMIESSRLDDDVVIGPAAHLRPGSHLGRGVKIGNFVEIKNSTLGPGTKANHLGYIGDADVGERVNFSCGAIVVNYDGYRKTRSEIGDDAFIGCNVNLVSPVRIEPKSFVAAGSTITKNVPEKALAVARERQRNIEGWVARRAGRSASEDGSAPEGSGAVSSPRPRKPRKKGGSAGKKAGRRNVAKKKGSAEGRPGRSGGKKTAAKKSAKRTTARKKASKRTTRKKAVRKSSSRSSR